VTFLNASFPILLFAVSLLNWKYVPWFWNPYTTTSYINSLHVRHHTLFLIFKKGFTTNILSCVVLCCIVSCRAVLCCVVLYRVVTCCVVSCCVVSFRVVLCCVVSYHVVLCCVVSGSVVLFCVVLLCCVVSYRVVSCRVVSCCVVLCVALYSPPSSQLMPVR
jgi:hypothetical protein